MAKFKTMAWVVTFISAVVFGSGSTAAETDDSRFTNSQYKVAFQPPVGWEPAILVQYIGPPREDGARAVLTLTAQPVLVDLSEQGIDELANESSAQISGEAIEGTEVTARKKLTISGLDALELDLSYKVDGAPMRISQFYVPVTAQNRTYLFTMEDTGDHFADTFALAEKAVNSFGMLSAANSSGPSDASAPPKGAAPQKPGAIPILPLLLVGFFALAIGVVSTYLVIGSKSKSRQ